MVLPRSLVPDGVRRLVLLGLAAAPPLGAQPGATRERTVEFYLPIAFGQRFNVLQGQDQGPTHNDKYNRYAVDFQMPVGTPVFAAADGVVVFVKEDAVGPTGKNSDNNKLVLRHADNTCSQYLHLQKDGVLVEVGQQVFAGDKIALSGNTGRSGSPHLHFVVFSSYPGGFSIPFRFVDAGIPATGQSPISANVPGREIVGGLLWLQSAYELCRKLDRRGALGKILKVQVARKKLPAGIAKRIRVAAKKGRKGLEKRFERHRAELRKICDADVAALLAAMDQAVVDERHADAARIVLQGNRDFAWHPEAPRFRSTQARLARDKALQKTLRPVLRSFSAERSVVGAFERAFAAAWKARDLAGKRREAAIAKVRKMFGKLSAGVPAGAARSALQTWVAAQR